MLRAALSEGQLYTTMFSEPEGHPRIAPDMSKPENYMRACFAVCRDKSFEVTFCIDGGGPCVLVTDFSEKVLSTNDEDWGGAAVAALAALYDAENAK